MAKTLQDLDELFNLVRDEDIATLRLIERELHALVERKERDEAARQQTGAEREALIKHCANVAIDPDLLALVGIHPENPVQDDKLLIRDAIARRVTD